MFAGEERKILQKHQLLEVICQLRFYDILKINTTEPDDFQEAIRAEYPQYAKKLEQLPPRIENGKPVAQSPVNNHQFLSADGRWKVSLTKSFIALSTHGYTRWEEFAKRLDRVLAAFIGIYHPSELTRVGLRYINAVSRKNLELEDYGWRELISPGYLGLMGQSELPEGAFAKNEQTALLAMPGGAKANIKCGPGLLRKVNNRTGQSAEDKVFMLDFDLFMDTKTPLKQAVPALNVVHGNADSLFRSAVTDTLFEAMCPTEP